MVRGMAQRPATLDFRRSEYGLFEAPFWKLEMQTSILHGGIFLRMLLESYGDSLIGMIRFKSIQTAK
jgi:hypothetical protein